LPVQTLTLALLDLGLIVKVAKWTWQGRRIKKSEDY